MSNYYNRMTELACWVASINVGEYDKDDIQQMVNAVGKEVSRDFYIKYGQKYGANVRNILTYIEEAQDGYWDAEGFEAETFEAMIEMITEKEMMQRINHVKEQLILTQGEGDMRFQEFRKWVRNQISEWYDTNEDYKKEMEEAVERLNERFGAENWRFSKEYDNYYTTMNARTGTGFYGDVIVSGYGYDEKEGREIEKEIVGLSIFLRKKISEWMQDRTNRASNLKWSGRKGNRTISKISHSAEEFEAEGDYTQPRRSREINNILWELRDLDAEQMFYTMLTYLPTKQANQLLNQLAKGLAEGEIPNRNLRLGAEGDDNSLNFATRFDLSRDLASFISSNVIRYGMEWSPQQQQMVVQSFKNETDYVKWIMNQFNRYAQEMIDNDIIRAEEFEAETISDNVAGIEIIVDDANMKHLPSIKASIAYNMQNPIGQWKCWGCGENYETSKKPKLIVMTKDKQGAFCGCGKRAETFGAENDDDLTDCDVCGEMFDAGALNLHPTTLYTTCYECFEKEIEEGDEGWVDVEDFIWDAESERTFTVSKGPKRMYIVVEYNDGKELFLDGDGQKQFMEELAEAEATGDEILIEKLFGVGSDYHGIAEEVVEAEGFEAQGYDEIEVEKYVEIDWETDPHPHPYDDDINNSEIFNEVSGYVEDAVERRGRDSGNGNIDVEIEVEDKEENEVVEKTVRVEYDYHLQGESFEATKNCVWCGSTENICCTNEASQNSVKGIKNRFGEEVIESFPMSNPIEEEYVCDECCFICGDKSVLIPNLIESSEMGHPESFEATKGIDTYSQPFEELRIKPSKAKVGILLASVVASGVWFVNKMKED